MSVRIPQQNRSRERRLRIIETALDLFSAKGLNKTSTNEIALKAGVSIGTFYSYFENKKTLFLEILKSHLDNFITGIYALRIDDTTPMKDIIRDHIVKAFQTFEINPAFHKEALVMKFSDPDVRRLFDNVEQEQLVIISSLLGHYYPGKAQEDLALVAKVAHSAVENVAHYVMFLNSPFSRDRLMDELTEMIHSYVSNLQGTERG